MKRNLAILILAAAFGTSACIVHTGRSRRPSRVCKRGKCKKRHHKRKHKHKRHPKKRDHRRYR